MISISYDDSTVILSTKTAPSVADGVNVKPVCDPVLLLTVPQLSVGVAQGVVEAIVTLH